MAIVIISDVYDEYRATQIKYYVSEGNFSCHSLNLESKLQIQLFF